MIYYGLTNGYESKTDEDRIFRTREQAHAYDLEQAMAALGLEEIPRRDTHLHRCLRFLADYLDDLPRVHEEARLEAAE